jgi:hypothetical protein
VGFEELFVLICNLSLELKVLLVLAEIFFIIITIFDGPAGIDQCFEKTYCSQAKLFRLHWASLPSSILEDLGYVIRAHDDLEESFEATGLLLGLHEKTINLFICLTYLFNKVFSLLSLSFVCVPCLFKGETYVGHMLLCD